MASNINLQDMPQLVLEKITSFLSDNQLLTLEQVSKKLKYAVDDHLFITDHLILGCLPTTEKQTELVVRAKDKEFTDGFIKIFERCGSRLRTIQFNVPDQFCSESFQNINRYIRSFFGSAELVVRCPNIEQFITSPKMVICEGNYDIFNQQNVVLSVAMTDIYVNQLHKLSISETCKLKSVSFNGTDEHKTEQILRMYPNLQQIILRRENFENFLKFLPRFVENGLKDLKIYNTLGGMINVDDVKELCNIGKQLRTLYISFNVTSTVVSSLNKLQLPKNVKFQTITIPRYLAPVNESICERVIACRLLSSHNENVDYNSIVKMKNLEEIHISEMQLMRIIAEEPFLKLTRISVDIYFRANHPYISEVLVQLLSRKGSQLTVIKLKNMCPLRSLLIALKHCKAALFIEIGYTTGELVTTNEDMMAIFNLPNLQKFRILHFNYIYASGEVEDMNTLHIIEKQVQEKTFFNFEYKPIVSAPLLIQEYLFKRI